MKKILSAFVKYPFYGKIVIVTLLLIGSISLISMKKATFPLVESKVITVSVSYQGATPKEMEDGVTTLIENNIRGISGIKEFSSISSENFAQVTIQGLSNYDMDELLADVKNAVDGVSNFPAGAEKPIVSKRRAKDMAIFITLSSDSDDLLKLNKEANRIEDDFLASGMISQISIMGLPSRIELLVEIDETQLRRYNTSFDEIKAAIASNNLDIHGGTIKNPREEIKIISRQRSVDPDEIKEIVVKTNPNGRTVKVGDIANVKLQFEETPNGSYVKGKPSVTFMIQKLMTEDLEEISNYVNAYAKEYNDTHEDSEIEILMDFLDIIDGQLSILIQNGLMGVLLVILMLSLLLNFRLSLWVAWGIPASFLGMFIVAALMGVTINIISLFGMILIIGILVDDGVVIGENIFTHFEMGKTPRRAAIDGTMEVLPAVITSIATTIIAFTPLFFIEGNLEMMFEMAFVVIIALLFSLAEGIFVLPGHLANPKVLKPMNNKSFYGKLRNKLDKGLMYVRDRLYIPLVRRILKHKGLSLAAVTALFIITIGLVGGGKILFTFFPQTPSDMFSIDLALKPGINEEITKEKLFWIETQIWEANQELMKENGDTINYVSATQVTIGNSFSGTESGTNAGMIRVFLNPLEDTQVNDQIIKRAISEKTGKIPEAYKYAVGASNRFGAPVSISLLGYDTDELEQAKNELEEELNKIPSLFNITDNSQIGSQEIQITLKPEAYVLGLTQSSLMSQIRNGYYGALAQRMQEGKDEIWVYVRYPIENRETVGQLENMMINTQQGQFPLSRVANLSTERSMSKINRYNGRTEIRVDAYLKDQSAAVPPILNYIETEILPDIMETHSDVTYMHQGQQKDTNEQMGSILKYFGIAFLIIVLIIMIYFKSFLQGFMILLMIPLGFLGAIWGHGIHGQAISMMSLWGFVALSGTIINDAIVFLSKYNQNLVKGMKVIEAAIDAGKSRFRAILLTTITTTAGLMPLILENSPDAQFLVPMAIALAYGILFGTVFILLILPLLIVIMNSLKLKIKNLFNKETFTPESVEVAVINHQIDTTLDIAMEKEF
jgi:multidrug efflux pump subunit AcrB